MLQPTQRGLTRSSTSYDLLPSKNNKILPDIVRCHQRRLCQDKDPADRSAGKMLRRWEWDGYTAVSDTTLVPVSTVPKWGSTTNVCGIPNHQVSNITGFWEGLNGWPDQRFRMEHTANVAIQVFGLAPTWLGKKMPRMTSGASMMMRLLSMLHLFATYTSAYICMYIKLTYPRLIYPTLYCSLSINIYIYVYRILFTLYYSCVQCGAPSYKLLCKPHELVWTSSIYQS